MSAIAELYHHGDSWLHRTDPRVKMALVVATTIVLLVSDAWWTMAVALVAAHLLLRSAGLSWGRIGQIWRALLPVVVIVIVLWPLFDRAGTPVLLEFGWFRVTAPAMVRGLTAAARLVAISLFVSAWLATTTPSDLIQGFVRIGLPRAWGVSLGIGLRAIPALAAIFRQASDAQAARGLIVAGNPLHRARQMVPVLIATLVGAIRLADQTSWALEARGFGAPVRPTVRQPLRMRPSDWFLLAIVLTLTVTLLAAWIAGAPL